MKIRGADGPAVLLLHGLTGSAASWGRVADSLGTPCRLLIPDLLGFGASPKPHGAYDLEAHCDALADIVSTHRPALVAGHSMGAVIALGLLTRYPELSGAVLVSPAVFESRAQARATMEEAPLLQRASVRSPRLAQALCMVSCTLRPLLRPFAPLAARDLPAAVARAGLDHTWESYSKSLDRVVLSGLVPGLLERVPQPVTVVHGRADRTVPLRLIQEIEPLVQRLTVIAGDHEALLKNPAPVAAAIEQALAR
ncbi:MAG: alpha/beta fold hydrolase [Tepidiformaceae bacterium]